MQDLADEFAQIEGVTAKSRRRSQSEDGEAAQLFVPIDTAGEVGATVEELRTTIDETLPDGLEAWVTGPAGFTADLVAGLPRHRRAAARGRAARGVHHPRDRLPIAAAAGPRPVHLAVRAVRGAADRVVAREGRHRRAQRSGAGHPLHPRDRRRDRLRAAVRGAIPRGDRRGRQRSGMPSPARGAARSSRSWPSGGTVIAGLLCLLLSDLATNRALGPIAAIGIAFAVLSALTFLPALLAIVGRAAFWPFIPKAPAAPLPDDLTQPVKGFWPRQARLVARRSRLVWIISTAVLLAASAGMLQLQADGVPSSDLVLGLLRSARRAGRPRRALPGRIGQPRLRHRARGRPRRRRDGPRRQRRHRLGGRRSPTTRRRVRRPSR